MNEFGYLTIRKRFWGKTAVLLSFLESGFIWEGEIKAFQQGALIRAST